MNELDFPQEKACNLYCDNKAVIIISENHVQHEQTKYAGWSTLYKEKTWAQDY